MVSIAAVVIIMILMQPSITIATSNVHSKFDYSALYFSVLQSVKLSDKLLALAGSEQLTADNFVAKPGDLDVCVWITTSQYPDFL